MLNLSKKGRKEGKKEGEGRKGRRGTYQGRQAAQNSLLQTLQPDNTLNTLTEVQCTMSVQKEYKLL